MTKKILILAPYPFDEAPSQRFRFEQYLEYLKDNGFESTLYPFLDDKGWRSLYKDGSFLSKVGAMFRSFWKRFMLLFRIRKYDHIFIHREASMIGPPFFEWFIAKVLRRKYIYDFDDAIWLPNYSDSNARFHRLKMYRKVKKIIKWADQVTVGNDFLADFAREFNQNVVVIPTTIDLKNVHNKTGNPRNEVPVIGWTGSHTTATYLADILPVLDRIYQEKNFVFRIISNQDPQLDKPYIEYIKWDRNSEIESLATFNVGVMPMEDSVWTKGKCGFKALQYMALQIPAVVTPVGVNSHLVQNDINGYLCSNDEEWYQYLTKLLDDFDLRSQLGKNGRQLVADQYSVEANKNKYLRLFE